MWHTRECQDAKIVDVYLNRFLLFRSVNCTWMTKQYSPNFWMAPTAKCGNFHVSRLQQTSCRRMAFVTSLGRVRKERGFAMNSKITTKQGRAFHSGLTLIAGLSVVTVENSSSCNATSRVLRCNYRQNQRNNDGTGPFEWRYKIMKSF